MGGFLLGVPWIVLWSRLRAGMAWGASVGAWNTSPCVEILVCLYGLYAFALAKSPEKIGGETGT